MGLLTARWSEPRPAASLPADRAQDAAASADEPASRPGFAVAEAPSRRQPNNFDALRLLAALLIVYSHQTVDRTGTAGLRLVMFFAISGFLVSGSWAGDADIRRFLARRFLRVWPAYAALIVTTAAITGLFPSPDLPDLSRLASLVYLSNLWFHGFDWGFFPFHDPFVNQSLWMIPYEVDTYLAFALVASLGRVARIVVASVVLALATGAQQTTSAAGGLLDCWSLYFAGFFAFGVLLRELPWLRRTGVVAGCVAGGVAALCTGWRTTGLLLVIPPGAVWIGQRSWPVMRSAARFGDLSFGVFLWSFPIQQVTRLWLDPGRPVSLQLAVVLVQVLPIAWLSYRYVEAPALRCKPGRPEPGIAIDPSGLQEVRDRLYGFVEQAYPRLETLLQPFARSSRIATAGSVLPSRNSRNAPPPVEM